MQPAKTIRSPSLRSRADEAVPIAAKHHPERADQADAERREAVPAQPLADEDCAADGRESGYQGRDGAGVERAGGAQAVEHAPEERDQRRADRRIAGERPPARPGEAVAPGDQRPEDRHRQPEAQEQQHAGVQLVGDGLAHRIAERDEEHGDEHGGVDAGRRDAGRGDAARGRGLRHGAQPWRSTARRSSAALAGHRRVGPRACGPNMGTSPPPADP